MIFLLDSNTVSDFYDRKSTGHQKIYEHLILLPSRSRVLISVLSLYEFEYGYANATDALRPLIRAKITDAQNDFELLPLSCTGARRFGEIKAMLKNQRGISTENIKKHNIDLMFAAEAIAHDLVLVSTDGIFEDIQRFQPELKLENWLTLS